MASDLYIERSIGRWIKTNHQNLNDPMLFITGPRQAGKTFFSKQESPRYYNWDTAEVKEAYLKDKYFFRDIVEKNKWVVFDEIHKKKDWKKIVKGYYDSPGRAENFIITGSGRFDQYQRGGDSLQGRYFSYQFWPFSYDEIAASKKAGTHGSRNWKTWEPEGVKISDTELINLGGFPAPFIRGKKTFLNQWMNQYIDRLIREDVRDFSLVQQLDKMEMLARLLPSRTMSPISEKSLSEDVEVSPTAIKSWLKIFEILYLGIYLKPYSKKIHRAVKKEKKWYFYQWTFNKEPAAIFENYIAIQLAAACSAWTEQGHGRWELFYLRDQDGREIDFIICKDLQPQCLIEAKSSHQDWTPALRYYTQKLNIPGFLVYPEGPTRRVENLGYTLPSAQLLKNLL